MILTSYVFAFFTLGMYVSIIGTIAVAFGWWVLTYQSFTQQKPIDTETPESGYPSEAAGAQD